MNIAGDLKCPVCNSGKVTVVPIYHHMLCAYVGPSYDFMQALDRTFCPKCKRELLAANWEIVGDCFYCEDCSAEVHL